MNYQEIKKDNQVQLVFNTIEQLDLSDLPEKAEILSLVATDSVYYYNSLIYKAVYGRSNKEMVEKNLVWLTSKIPFDIKDFNTTKLIGGQSLVSRFEIDPLMSIIHKCTTGSGKKDFFTSSILFLDNSHYPDLYESVYKKIYPMTPQKAGELLKAQDQLYFNSQSFRYLKGWHFFQNQKELHDWMNSELSSVDRFYWFDSFGFTDSATMLKQFEKFAVPEVYKNFQLATVVEMFNFSKSHRLEDFEDFYKDAIKLLSHPKVKATTVEIKSEFVDYLKDKFNIETLKVAAVESIIENPANILQFYRPRDEAEKIVLEKLVLTHTVASTPNKARVLKV